MYATLNREPDETNAAIRKEYRKLHDETNAAIREEYRKHDEKKFHDGKVERLESEKKKKIIFPILLAAVLLIVAIGTALYLILN